MPDAQQHGDLLVRQMWTLSVSQAIKRNLKGGSSSLHYFVSEVIFIYVPIQLLILQLFLPDPVSGHLVMDAAAYKCILSRPLFLHRSFSGPIHGCPLRGGLTVKGYIIHSSQKKRHVILFFTGYFLLWNPSHMMFVVIFRK